MLLMLAGSVVVVATGSSNVDACTSSPASADEVICVGATSEGLCRLLVSRVSPA